MSTFSPAMDHHLAKTVQYTGQLKLRHAHRPALRPAVNGLDFLARGVFHVWRNRRYLTCVKLLNMALIQLQFKLKTQRVIGRPYKMKIESTNICNTHCQLCPTGLNLPGRAKGKMSLDQFKNLIDRLHWHLFALDLSMWGDPLIVPDICQMIRYAHDRGIWTYISSNLHAFKLDPQKDQARQLIESGLDMFTCSLHGASQHTYEQYQPGKNFDQTIEKIRHLIQTRDRLGSATPVVQLNFVVTRLNEHEKEAFRKLAAELGCKAVFSQASLNLRLLDKNTTSVNLGLAPDLQERKAKDHMDKWLPEDQGYVLKAYDMVRQGAYQPEDYNGRKLMNCSWPWQSSVINWDGQVVTCCGSWDVSEDMGNVFEQPFGRIWNSQKYRLARLSFTRPLTAEQARNNPCAHCPGFML